MITFGLCGASSAALGRRVEAAASAGMALLTIARVIVGSLYTEPLVLAGAIGLFVGVGLLVGLLQL